MDFTLSERQAMLQKTFRSFLEKECPESLVRRIEDSRLDYDHHLWAKLAGIGALGLGIDERFGGAGRDLTDLAIFYEEAGRAMLPSPHLDTVVLAGQAVHRSGSAEVQGAVLPKIAAGQLIIGTAITEKAAEWGPDEVQLDARPEQGGWVLNGTKQFVQHAEIADTFLVAARTGAGMRPNLGITLFLVDAQAFGVYVRPFNVISGQRLFEVKFFNVFVPQDRIVGEEGLGWPALLRVLDIGKAALAAQMAGAAEALLWKTVEYAKQRVTFGRPLGSNQVIQHRLADLAIRVHGGKYQAYKAMWRLQQEVSCPHEVAAAKVLASDGYRWVANESMQIHGGYGFAKDFSVQLYWRRHKFDEVLLGDSQLSKEAIGTDLGL